MRGAALALVAALCIAAPLAGPAQQVFGTPGPDLVNAHLGDSTTRYAHGVLGDAAEWGSLTLLYRKKGSAGLGLPGVRFILPPERVFEDVTARVVPLRDGGSAAMVVESDRNAGARLTLWTREGLVAATDFIGRRNRWLAPAGAADFDGDGHVDYAYVDRPHLAKTLRIVTQRGDRLVEIAAAPGLTNHRIGEDFISGGVRDCGGPPEVITADAAWSRIMASRIENGRIVSRDLGVFTGPNSLVFALKCP